MFKIVLQAVVIARRPSFDRSPFKLARINLLNKSLIDRGDLNLMPRNPVKSTALVAEIFTYPFIFGINLDAIST